MEPLATSDDIIGGADIDETTLELLLGRASAIVRAYADNDWVNDDGELEDVPEAIPGVVAAMVERAVSNPSGVIQEGAGPFQRSFGADAAARLYLTNVEKRVIRRAIGASGLAAVSLSRGPVETATPRVDPSDDLTEIAT